MRLVADQPTCDYPRIASSGSYIHVVWQDCRSGFDEVYYKRSTDNGLTWSDDVLLSPADRLASSRPDVAMVGNYVYAVWEDLRSANMKVYFRRSSDNGLTWEGEQQLLSPSGSCYRPSIAATTVRVYVAYHSDQPGNYDIFLVRSVNCGASWHGPINISNSAGNSRDAELAAEGYRVYAVWSDCTLPTEHVYFNYSDNNGAGWYGTECLSPDDGASHVYPDVACNNARIAVVWEDRRISPSGIYCRMSANGGIDWGEEVWLAGESGYGSASRPHVDLLGQIVYVVWSNFTAAQNAEIYFNKSVDGGAGWIWDLKGLRLTTHWCSSSRPDIAVGGEQGYPRVVWVDDREGNEEIFFNQQQAPSEEQSDDDGDFEYAVEWCDDYSEAALDRGTYGQDEGQAFADLLEPLDLWEPVYGFPYTGFGNNSAHEKHFGVDNDTWIDRGDLAYLSSHGYVGTVPWYYFSEHGDQTYQPHNDPWLTPDDAVGAWGDLDLEWIGFKGCNALAAYREWAQCFGGAHLILGFGTPSYRSSDTIHARYWLDNMLRSGPADPAKTVLQSWFLATESTQPKGVVAVVLGKDIWRGGETLWDQGGVVYVDPWPVSSADAEFHVWTYTAVWKNGVPIRVSTPANAMPVASMGAAQSTPIRLMPDPHRVPAVHCDPGALPRASIRELMPHYNVIPATYDEGFAQFIISHLCAAEGIFCNPGPIQRDEDEHLCCIDGAYALQIDPASGAVQFVNTATWMIGAPTPPVNLPQVGDAQVRAEGFLGAMGVDTDALDPDETCTLMEWDENALTGEIVPGTEWATGHKVGFRRVLDGFPVMGAGAYRGVTIGDSSRIAAWSSNSWRNLTQGGEDLIMPSDSAVHELEDLGPGALIEGELSPADWISVHSMEKGFFEKGPDQTLAALTPVWILHTTVHQGGLEFEEDLCINALHTHPRAEITEPADCSWAIVGELITFRGTASEGAPGYTYDWYSDVDGYLGSGSEIQAALSLVMRESEPMMHTVTLQVTDRNEMTRRVHILVGVMLPPEGTGERGSTARDLDLSLENPHPALGPVEIVYVLRSPSRVRLQIYNAAGQLVRRLADGAEPAGEHRVTWDTRNEAGLRAESGVYFCRLEAQGKVVRRNLLLIK